MSVEKELHDLYSELLELQDNVWSLTFEMGQEECREILPFYGRLTEGAIGGDCWGGVAEDIEAYDLDTQAEFQQFCKTAASFDPELQYLRPIDGLIEEKELCNAGDWYGNYEAYLVKYMPLEKVYEIFPSLEGLLKAAQIEWEKRFESY